MSRQTAYVLTNFGDPAVTLSIAVLLLLWLWSAASRELALRWAAAVLGCGLALTGLYAVFRLAHDVFGPLGLRVPSGHVAGTALAYGALAVIAAQGASARRHTALAAAATAVIVMIAATRLRLGAHTLAEVLVGCATGLVALAWFARRYVRVGRAVPAWGAATVAAGALVAGAHGLRLDVWVAIRTALLHIKTAIAAAL